jgi:hypothetical protein
MRMNYWSVSMVEKRNIPRELRLDSVPSFAPASLLSPKNPERDFKTWEKVIDDAHATIKVRQA